MMTFLRRLFGRERVAAEAAEPLTSGGPAAPFVHEAMEEAAANKGPTDYLSFADYPVEERDARLAEVDVSNAEAREMARMGAQRMVNRLPPFPAVANQVFAVIQNPNSRAADIAAVVNRDPAMAASVLKLASSSLYAPGDRQVVTVRDAVVRLGYGEVARVAASIAAGALFDRRTRAARAAYKDAFDALWSHAIATAFTAASFAIERGSCDPNEAFLGGLLHDIGKSIALEGAANECALRIERAEPGAAWLAPAVLNTLLEDLHSEIGHSAVVSWRLPDYLCEVVRGTHAVAVPPGEYAGLLHTIRVVSGLDAIRMDPGHPVELHSEVRSSAVALRLDDRALAAIVNSLRQSSVKAAALRNNVQ